VKWLSHIKDRRQLIKLIKESEILVHPSTQEGYGIAIVEAMACRTPVVAVESTGAREFLKEAGYITPSNSKAMAQVILELHTSPKKRKEAGKSQGKSREVHMG